MAAIGVIGGMSTRAACLGVGRAATPRAAFPGNAPARNQGRYIQMMKSGSSVAVRASANKDKGGRDRPQVAVDAEEDYDLESPLETPRKPYPTAGHPGVLQEAYTRGRWLLALLILQSSSSFVLDRYRDLIQDHIVITLFLTMLVGAGGNAGNQTSIKIIKGIATGQMDKGSFGVVLREQILVGCLLGTGLAGVGYLRVYLSAANGEGAFAISLSLFLIVLCSTALGTVLPFALLVFGGDEANAGTTIQVLMDILGVTITCVCCSLVFNQLSTTLIPASHAVQ